MAAPFDIWDQAVVSRIINRPLTTLYEDQPMLGGIIAPNVDIRQNYASLQSRQTLSFGKGQFRAPDATPPLYKPNQTWQETIVELALLDEMERLSERDMQNLESVDDAVSQAAGVEFRKRGTILRTRQERLTEWMRWQAFTGVLVIPYGDSQELVIDYGFPSGNKPTVSTAWSDLTNSDPIADLNAFSAQLASTSGYYGLHHHMSSTTWGYIVKNAKLKALLTATDRSMLIPTQDDAKLLLRDGTTFTIYDNGYRDDGNGSNRGLPNSLTRYLADGYVLTTTDYNIEGNPIAETLNGLVGISTDFNRITQMMGPQSEVMVHHLSKNTFLRQAASRIPRINNPECFLYGKVV